MTFNLETWKQQAGEKARQIGHWLDRRQTQDAPYLVYGTLCGLSLWPLVEAAQTGQVLPVMMALGSVAGGVGGNLVANQIQSWKEEAEPVDEMVVAEWVAEHAPQDAELRQSLDDILDSLETLSQAQNTLSGADRQWFTETLQKELAALGNLKRYEAVLLGSGAIAQGPGAVAAGQGGVAVGGNVEGGIHIGGRAKDGTE